MRHTTKVTWITLVFMAVVPGVGAKAFGVECANFFRELPQLLKVDDDRGCCRMENASSYPDYPPESIPYNLRTGREVCSCRGNGRVDREFMWHHGKRTSGTFYGSHVYASSNVVEKVEYSSSGAAAGPARIFQNDKLFCEIPVTENGKVTGIAKEYTAAGRLAWQATLLDGKVDGASVRYDDRGRLVSFTCGAKPLFEGDRERCGFDGRPSTVELQGTGGRRRMLTHLKGKLTAEESISRDGEREVKRYPGGDPQTVQVEHFFKNGKLQSRHTKKKQQLEGAYCEFFDSGTPAEEGRAVDGKIVQLKRYYMNGGKKVEATVSSDPSVCAVRQFSSDGRPEMEGTFKTRRGEVAWQIPHGRVRYYDEGGRLYRDGEYVDGAAAGIHTFYLEGGEKAEVLFDKGKPKRLREYGKGGEVKESEIYDDGSLRQLLRRSGRYL